MDDDERQTVGNSKDAIKLAKQQRELSMDALSKFAKSEGGRIFITNLARNSKVLMSTFSGNSVGMYDEGVRHAALGLLKNVREANPEAYAEIMKDI